MTPAFLTVRQAAERAGVSRQTMFRYIKEGKISATLSRSGEKQIQVAELIRVFGELQPETVSSHSNNDRSRLSPKDSETVQAVTHQLELERLRNQLEFKTAELELAKERISELKAREANQAEERNQLLSIIERHSLLLTTSVPAKKVVAKASSPAKKTVEKPAPAAKKTSATKVSKPTRDVKRR